MRQYEFMSKWVLKNKNPEEVEFIINEEKIMKKILYGIVLGICIAITGFFVYFTLQLEKQVSQNTTSINQVVSYLNQQIQAQQKASGATK